MSKAAIFQIPKARISGLPEEMFKKPNECLVERDIDIKHVLGLYMWNRTSKRESQRKHTFKN